VPSAVKRRLCRLCPGMATRYIARAVSRPSKPRAKLEPPDRLIPHPRCLRARRPDKVHVHEVRLVPGATVESCPLAANARPRHGSDRLRLTSATMRSERTQGFPNCPEAVRAPVGRPIVPGKAGVMPRYVSAAPMHRAADVPGTMPGDGLVSRLRRYRDDRPDGWKSRLHTTS
jgi:hypothetical protein